MIMNEIRLNNKVTMKIYINIYILIYQRNVLMLIRQQV